MSEVNAFKALSLGTTICVGMSPLPPARSICVAMKISPSLPHRALGNPIPLAAELERCRTISYEQKDRLADCRKLWADKRRQFLGQGSEFQQHSVRPRPRSARRLRRPKDQSRLPSGYPRLQSESER